MPVLTGATGKERPFCAGDRQGCPSYAGDRQGCPSYAEDDNEKEEPAAARLTRFGKSNRAAAGHDPPKSGQNRPKAAKTAKTGQKGHA